MVKFLEVFSEMFSDEFKMETEYVNQSTPIQLKHKKCGYSFNIKPVSVSRNKTCKCPKCNIASVKYTIKGVNDIATTNPELVHLFKDKEDAYKYKKYSVNYTWFVCPYCGKEYYLQIQNVTKSGKVTCHICNDGFSYPNKFMANLLSQLNIDYIKEYSPDWIAPLKYDFYFEVNSEKYIVEMDGGLGHGNSMKKSIRKHDDDGVSIDKFKDEMANKYGINMIRIDCNYTSKRFEYVVNSIKNSILSNIIDLSKIDFIKCDKESNNSIFYNVLVDFKNGIFDTNLLAEKHSLSQTTIRTYINIAINNGLILKDDVEKYRYEYRKNISTAICKRCMVYCNETGEIFNSMKEADRKYGASLTQYFNKNGKSSGRLSDGTKLTWKKLSKEEYQELINSRAS